MKACAILCLTVAMVCAAPASAETYTFPLSGLLGNYGSSTDRVAYVDLGTHFLSITQAKFQCSGTLSPGLWRGDGVEMPISYYEEMPASVTAMIYGFGRYAVTDGCYATTPSGDGAFSADPNFRPYHPPDSGFKALLSGHVELHAALTLDLSFGLTVVDSPAGSLTSAALYIEGVPCEAYPGDVNKDDVVDVADLGILGARLNDGRDDHTWEDGDFNGDGLVDIGDLGVLGAQYGTIVPPVGGGAAAIPEPGTLTAMALAAAALLGRKRR